MQQIGIFSMIIIIAILIMVFFIQVFGRWSLIATIPLAIFILFFMKDARGDTMYTGCMNAPKYEEQLLKKYRTPFKLKVFYQNGDTELLVIHPINTWGELDPVDLRITSSRQGKNGMLVPHSIGSGMGGVPISGSGLSVVPGRQSVVGGELKSHWTLNVNGMEIPYGNTIATGVRRFEKL